MVNNMKWKDTTDGRMSIYYLATYLADDMKEESYISNKDAKVSDADKIIEFLRVLIITEWVN